MKKHLSFWSLLLFVITCSYAVTPTVLQPGDIAIVQVNKAYESFDFVPLVPITAGTKILFSDMKYSATLKGFIPFGNLQYTGIHTFTATQNYAAGTVIQSSGNLDESKKFITSGTTGLSLIAFQVNDGDTTFITAIGWLAAENFKAGVNDIPPGLSVANNTVVKFDSTETYFNKYLYYSVKFDNMGDASKQEGTAVQLRRRFADVSNYTHTNSVVPNAAVPDFNVLAPDLTSPTLVSSYPTQNKINVSPISGVELKFSEAVIAKNAITIRNVSSGATQYITPADVIIEGSDVSFSYGANLEYATNYTLEFLPGTFTDLDNNPWPSVKDTIIPFATSAKRSVAELYFRNKAKEDLVWTTTKKNVTEWDTMLEGFWSFSIDGIPMRYYKAEIVQNEKSAPSFNGSGEIWMTNPAVNSRLVVDLSAINNTVTTINSHLYTNNVPLFTQLYSNGNVILSKTINNTTDSYLSYSFGENNLGYEKQFMLNENDVKIDSIVYRGMESVIFALKIELIDLDVPVVELGANRTICQGDSVKLDAGFTPGAVYTWNTGATTQKITVKTTDTYSVTVKNTLGQRSDNVLVTVRPTISVSLPDTIYACVGDTVTLVAGTDVSNSYFWSPNGQTTPSIKVTQSGIYHVLVNNGFGGCFTTDSTRVIYKGAKLHAYHYQGGIYGTGDVRCELYRKNNYGKFILNKDVEMLQAAQFDSLQAGDYILKAHFVSYSFMGENPWMDTYHDGKTEWTKVIPFKLTCTTDTMIGFLMAGKPMGFEFNGTAVISGKIAVTGASKIIRQYSKATQSIADDCSTKVLLYNGSGDLIATTCPDMDGNYSFSNLPAGNYSVGIERTGYVVESLYTTTVSAGTTISNANFTIDENSQTIEQGLQTAINSAKNDLEFEVYPNPIKDKGYVSIRLENPEIVTICMIDLTGKIIRNKRICLTEGDSRIEIPTDDLHGMYLLKINTDKSNAVKRVIIE